MKYVLLDRTYTPALAAPMTDGAWMQFNHRLDGCLESRSVHWLYSLVSVQGDRSLCLFEVPYTELVREACREACMPFQSAWQVEAWVEEAIQALPSGVSLVITEVIFDPPMTKAVYDVAKKHAAGCLQELRVRPIVSLVTSDGKASICLFTATSAEDVRSLYRKLNQPFEKVWNATLIRPVYPPSL